MSHDHPGTLLCVLETGVEPSPATRDNLLARGFERRPGAVGPRYFGRTGDSLPGLIGWLVTLDWTPQRDIPHRPMLMFKTDREREFSYYAVPTRPAEVSA